jgi:glycosyltransferase involved in cell wall biosynthesis
LVCLEAPALGKPIVSFADAGGAPEFVGGDCGVVVPYLDVTEMAHCIVSLAGDAMLCERLGSSARAKVPAANTANVLAPRLLQLIEAISCSTTVGEPYCGVIARAVIKLCE